MPTNLLLLPLLGGYWFLHTLHYTGFRSRRLDGYRLLVESALVGVVLASMAWLLLKLIALCPCSTASWLAIAPNLPYLGTMTASLLLGLLLPYVANSVLEKTGIMSPLDAQMKAIDAHGNGLLRLLHMASREEKMVSISLDNGKFYVGLVAAAPNLEPHDTFLSITPFYSGYRDKETHRLMFTVDYLKVYDKHALDPEDCRVVVPMSSIRMASLFDQTAYPAFIVESDPEAEEIVT